jgi:putative FmdB family regulatory protein
MYDFYCPKCEKTEEKLVKHSDVAPKCHGPMVRLMGTPAFTFKNGKGTSGGNTMRIAGRPVPSGE